MLEPIIHTERLTKAYGRARGIEDLDLEVLPGEVFGFLGPNGAGKTTTIRVLLDFIRPTSGRALLFGLDSRRDSRAIRRRGSATSRATSHPYDSLSGLELLTFLRPPPRPVVDRGRPAIAARLDCDLDREIRTLSARQPPEARPGLQALMGDPSWSILDEPTLGLDPLVQAIFFELVDERGRLAGRSSSRPTTCPRSSASATASASSATAGCSRSNPSPT